MATQHQFLEAQQALHNLELGKSVARIQKDGRMVEYTPAKIADLRAYVNKLSAEVGAGGRQRRAFGVTL